MWRYDAASLDLAVGVEMACNRASFRIGLVGGVVILAAEVAAAVEFRAGQNVVVAADEVIEEDLYVTGDTVTIDGTVRGDVVASGREVTLNGTVEGDLMACGQAVVINGRVGDDARIAGMALKLGLLAEVVDDLVAAGFSLETEGGSSIGGTLLVAGFQALLGGDVSEDVKGSGSAIQLAGTVGGSVDLEMGESTGAGPLLAFLPTPVVMPAVSPGLTLADSARIGGDLSYTSAIEAYVASGSETLGTSKHRLTAGEAEEAPGTRAKLLQQLRRLVTLFVVGLMLAWLAPGWLPDLAATVRRRPLQSLGWGLGAVIALPVAMLALFGIVLLVALLFGLLTLSGLAALVVVTGLFGEGVLTAVLWLGISFVAPLVIGLLVGRLVLERAAPDRAGGRIVPLLVGLVLLAALGAVPYLGRVVGFAVALLGLGALIQQLWSARRQSALAGRG